jgi:hypothetical protein
MFNILNLIYSRYMGKGTLDYSVKVFEEVGERDVAEETEC